MSSLQTEPLLSSLCSNCRMNTPKYTCPACSRHTCSLACVKQHKSRVPCSGVRGIQKIPLKELLTVTGINNDYNFITRIERGIERAERIIIHEKGLIPKRRDREPIPIAKRRQLMDKDRKLRIFESDGTIQKEILERKVAAAAQRSGVFVKKAPVGMQRRKDNETSIAMKNHLNWQIEWIADDGTRTLDKLAETTPLGHGYEEGVIRRARAAMTTKERNACKKRKEKEIHRHKNAKRRKLDEVSSTPILASSYLQNARTSLWNVSSSKCILPGQPMENPAEVSPAPKYHFYLLRPFTPSSRPKVLIPLDSSKPLSELLRHQVVFEFPTIYVSINTPKDMPKSFMMEKDFLAPDRREKSKDKSKVKGKALVEYSDSESESNAASDSGSESGSSSDGDSDSDSQSEDDEEESSKDEDDDEEATSWSESSTEDADEDRDTAMVET